MSASSNAARSCDYYAKVFQIHLQGENQRFSQDDLLRIAQCFPSKKHVLSYSCRFYEVTRTPPRSAREISKIPKGRKKLTRPKR